MIDPVILFPGQGSQAVGMGKELFDEYASVRALFEQASEATDLDLEELCFAGPAETLVQTENVQPAITLVNLCALQVLRERGVRPAAAAGHSLGEYAALCAAGVLSVADTLRLVKVRGRAMQAAADRHPGSMSAVIGLDADTLSGICEEVADIGSVQVANHNSAGQVALTGEVDALKRAGEIAKERGAKLVIPLKVSGAWHSRFMAEAQDAMRAALEECEISEPTMPVVANLTARPYASADDVVDHLVDQIVSPVLWARSMEALIRDGHDTFVEAGPGRVLTGFFRDIDRDVRCKPVQSPATLDKAMEMLAESAD